MAEKLTEMRWEVAALRLSTFSNVEKQPNIDEWWQQGIGLTPETVIQQRQQARIKYETSYENGRLVLTYQPTRIDWVYEFVEKSTEPQSKFTTLGQFTEKVETFHSLMDRWLSLESLPDFKRIAFGAILLYPVLNTQMGYEKLSELLPFDIDTENSSDFFYQINRRRKSETFSDLLVNRLSKWSVLKLQTALIRTDIATHQLVTLPETYACRLELDINTAQNFEGELEQDKLSDLFYELISFGKEIALKGDVP